MSFFSKLFCRSLFDQEDSMRSIKNCLSKCVFKKQPKNEDEMFLNLRKYLVSQGWLVTRVENTTQAGFPDILGITPGGTTVYLEMKRADFAKNVKITSAQKKYLKTLAAQKAKVFLLALVNPMEPDGKFHVIEVTENGFIF